MEPIPVTADVKSIFSFTNIILFVVLGYLIYARITKKSIPVTLSKPLEPLPFGEYTPRKLRKFNGVDDPHILMAVKGKVYDVTAGSMFYGPKFVCLFLHKTATNESRGPYKNFGGRDASRALAMGSFEDDMFVDCEGPIDKLDDLDAEQQTAVNDWVAHFNGKYIHAGSLIDNE